MFPAFAGLLPGLMSAGGKFLRKTGADILAGKNVLKSAKENAIEAANEILPGAGDILEKGIAAVGKFIGGRKQIAANKGKSKAGMSDADIKKAKSIHRRVQNGDVRSADVLAWHAIRKKLRALDSSAHGVSDLKAIGNDLFDREKWLDKWAKKFPEDVGAPLVRE